MSLTGISDADLWWPWQMGKPTLHNLTIGFTESQFAAEWLGPAASKSDVVAVGLREAYVALDTPSLATHVLIQP